MNYKTALLKHRIELIIIFPFVLLGKLAGKIFKLKTKHGIFLFFPSADIGGSIKVNADITQCIQDQRPLIIFSKKPKNNQFFHLFQLEGVRIIDLHKYIDKKIFHFVNIFFRGILSSWINQAKNPVIFGGESLFFYKILPHVKKNTQCVELCHLNTWFNFSQAYIKYIDARIFSTPKIKRDAEQQYKMNNLSRIFYDKLLFINNKVDFPEYKKINNSVLEVIFVGRGAPQKRVHLIAEIARRMIAANKPVHFSFVGDVEKLIPESLKNYVTVYGNIRDEEKMHDIYIQSDALLLTSKYEGLPLVIMEMMARGKVVVSTDVDGVPDYITHLENGLLISETDEEEIINKAIEYIDMLIANKELRKKIGDTAYQYAVKHFSGEAFCNFYRNILLGSYLSA